MTSHEYTAPSCWASFLINGDASGISSEDEAQCSAWLKRLALGSPASCEDAGCRHAHDAWAESPLSGDCQTYTFLR